MSLIIDYGIKAWKKAEEANGFDLTINYNQIGDVDIFYYKINEDTTYSQINSSSSIIIPNVTQITFYYTSYGLSSASYHNITGSYTISGDYHILNEPMIINFYRSTCFIEGTQISLGNGLTKNVEDITYVDELLVWNFDEGKFDTAKPLWIQKQKTTNKYTKLTFDDGTILSLIGEENKAHRVFDYDKGYFEYGSYLQIGARTSNDKGELITLIDKETIYEVVEYYNIITDYHMNLFANTVLTSCGYNNIYPIENMKFVKDERELIPIEDYNVDKKWYTGLRLGEQDLSLRSIEKAHKYIANLVENDINQ